MLLKNTSQALRTLQKARLCTDLASGVPLADALKEFSASEMQLVRNYLKEQILHYSASIDRKQLMPQDLAEAIGPIPNYYHKQDCREPLEACLNETCISSFPHCFSRKMNEQSESLAKLLFPYLIKKGEPSGKAQDSAKQNPKPGS
ncbi:MAG: hypothetical protein AAFP70_00420 [Calditrichota bacterium]